MPGDHLGARLTVEIAGSFGTLQYALLAFATSSAKARSDADGQPLHYSLTEDMLRRGFRRTCNSDYADIALKAQRADGSILCRASADGLVSLWFDDNLVCLSALTQEMRRMPSGYRPGGPGTSLSLAATIF